MKKIIAISIIIIILGVGTYFYMNTENIKENENINVVEEFYTNKEIWQNFDLMPIGGIAGIYKTGYTFFDIDLDGEKELAVQLGGGTLHNCNTIFYEYENSQITEKSYLDETYSISVNDLRKFKNESNEDIYINKYTLKIEPTKYITCYDEIKKGESGLIVNNIFSIEQNFNENSESEYKYLIDDKETDSITYYEEYDKYFNSLKEEMLVINFISSEDWQQMNDEKQRETLEKAYSKEDYDYVVQIKNEVISKKETAENTKEYDVVLSKTMYGEELEEYKNITKVEEVTAKVITDEKTFVQIIPTPDFLNNQTFYFSEGKKVAYVKEFVGIGGEVEYYLKNGEIVFINKAGIEENMIFVPENANDMLTRANNIYNKYIK